MIKFEYYVLNYNWNAQKVEMYNVFRNINVNERTEAAIEQYLRNPEEYTKNDVKGFDALCVEILFAIKWQEWARREYEISVGDAFEKDVSKLEKWDCYKQCIPNIKAIVRECLHQYEEQKNG